MPGPDPLAGPPAAPPTSLAPVWVEPASLWRLHWEDDPRRPDPARQGGSRFDAPHGDYLVSYGNEDRLAIFAEVFGDRGTITPANGERRLSLLSPRRPLRILTLDDAVTRRYFNLDGRICDTDDYETTRAWSQAFHAWYPATDGLRYSSRHASPHRNYCLYLDRCADDLDVLPQGQLKNLRSIVLFAADRYRLSCHIDFA